MNFLVIDNDWLAVGGTAAGIRTTFENAQVFEASTVDKGCELLKQNPQVELVVLDLNLGDTNGFDTLRRFQEWRRTNDSTVRVVVLSGAGSYNPPFVHAILGEYQTGFIPKGTAIEKFRHALRLTMDDGIYVPEELYNGMAVIGDEPANSGRAFTPMEYLVAHFLVGRQLTNVEIARQVQKCSGGDLVSEETIRIHIRHIAWKLGVVEGERPKAAAILEIARRQLTFPLPAKGDSPPARPKKSN